MQRIFYIINPIAGTRSKKGLQQLIERETTARQIPFTIFPSVAGGDYSFLKDRIREEKITDVVIAGGDGTVSQVVQGLADCGVNFGIIPCGSGNGLAFAAGIPKQPALALELVFRGKARPTDAFTVNGQFACMLCGLGFDAQVAHAFAQQTKRGLGTYVRQVLRHYFSARTYSFLLTVNDRQLSVDAYWISIANSNQFGNNFTIAPKASLQDGLLDIVIVTRQHKLRVLYETLKQVRGKNALQAAPDDKKKGVIYFQCEALRLVNESLAPLHIDGDPAETPGQLDIAVQKNYFRLIQPE